MLYGYDIDGVITKGITINHPCVVISGRTFSEYDELCSRLSNEYPLYIRWKGKYGDAKEAGEFKAMMINYLGIEEFYEDDLIQASIIRERCKNCNVVII